MLGENEIRQFIISCRARGIMESTLDNYTSELDVLLRWSLQRRLNPIELSRTEIGQFIRRETRNGTTPKAGTVNQRLTVLKSLYRWLWEEEYIPENTAAKVRAVKTPERYPQPIPHDEWRAMWGVAVGERVRAALVLTHYCGLRGNEVRSLNTDQIGHDVILGLVRKGGKKVMLPWRKMIRATAFGLPQAMPSLMQPVLSAVMAVKKYPTIWPAGADREWLRDRYKDVSAGAGLLPINPHRGRASAASNLLRAGVPIQHVKWLLDISRWQTLHHYIQSGRLEFNEWYDRLYGEEGT